VHVGSSGLSSTLHLDLRTLMCSRITSGVSFFTNLDGMGIRASAASAILSLSLLLLFLLLLLLLFLLLLLLRPGRKASILALSSFLNFCFSNRLSYACVITVTLSSAHGSSLQCAAVTSAPPCLASRDGCTQSKVSMPWRTPWKMSRTPPMPSRCTGRSSRTCDARKEGRKK
jgi:hypothetical protein